MKIVGYSGKWSASAGEDLPFFIGCAAPEYRVELRRLIHGDPNPLGPGVKEEVVEHALNHQVFKGEEQHIYKGSCLRIPKPPSADVITLAGAFHPTLIKVEAQTLISLATTDGRIFSVNLENGGLALRISSGSGSANPDSAMPTETLGSAQSVELDRWYIFQLQLDLSKGLLSFAWRGTGFKPFNNERSLSLDFPVATACQLSNLLFAAWDARKFGSQWRVSQPFNGRLADLRLYTGAEGSRALQAAWSSGDDSGLRPTAAWDFVKGAEGEEVPDVAGGNSPGHTINRPMRLLAGPSFAGQAQSAFDAPHLFNAAHFHDDDLSDAGWKQSFVFSPPEDLPSGVYAFRVTCEGGQDCIPFFVTARPGKEQAPLAVLMPTLSYHIYANATHDIGPPIDSWPKAFVPLVDLTSPETQEEAYVREQRLNSCYDHHSDGSGVCMATMLRPLVKFMRPDSRARIDDSPQHLSADLCLIDWLHEKDISYEIVTDHDLHARGHAALAPYRAVVTGSHSEYWTSEMLDGLEHYTNGGGRFICLSGNSLYWVTALSTDGVLCEVRRNNGVRAWISQPYEVRLSLTGTQGGLWRDHGRAAQRYVGTGFIAQGFDLGRPYTRLPASYTSRAAFLFEGIEDEAIGDFPALHSQYGAAGMEFDRVDYKLGTPTHAVILARATGFSDSFQIDVAEAPIVTPFFGGTQSPDVYSDMVFYETPNDGAVFSAPSISWSSTLSYNAYDNSVSKLTENVVRSFLKEGPLGTGH